MEGAVEACALLNNMIVEERIEADISTKNIISIGPYAEIIPISTPHPPDDHYNAADFYRVRADAVDDLRDHEMLLNSLQDYIWETYGRGELICNLHYDNSSKS